MESSLCLKPARCFLTRCDAKLLSVSLVQNGCSRRLETEAALGRKVTSVFRVCARLVTGPPLVMTVSSPQPTTSKLTP